MQKYDTIQMATKVVINNATIQSFILFILLSSMLESHKDIINNINGEIPNIGNNKNSTADTGKSICLPFLEIFMFL